MSYVREPAVAGSFYPDNPAVLTAVVEDFLAEAAAETPAIPAPKAIIAPHAGYIYSGPVAARAYAALAPARGRVERVVLLGPTHYVPVRGLAAPAVDGFRTPLGVVPLDRAAIDRVSDLPQVILCDQAHADEHALEVHLPFLQSVLGEIRLVPFAVGEAAPAEVAEVLDRLWGGPETAIVVSSDLSHYHDYATAVALDAATAQAIEAGDTGRLVPEGACGCRAIAGLLVAAIRHGLSIERLDLRNSGDTAGPRDQVVGYGAWALRATGGVRPPA